MLVGAHALLANGGIIAPAGTALVAQAAKKHAVPFVVLVVSPCLNQPDAFAAQQAKGSSKEAGPPNGLFV